MSLEFFFDQAVIAAAQLILRPGTSMSELSKEVNGIIDSELAHIDRLCNDLAYGKIRIC